MSDGAKESVELLPCPFCGGENAEILDIAEGPQAGCRLVECYECFASTGGKIAGPAQDQELIAAWNTRAMPTQPNDIEAAIERILSIRNGMTPDLEARAIVRRELAAFAALKEMRN